MPQMQVHEAEWQASSGKAYIQLEGHCLISKVAWLVQSVLICSVMVVGKLPGLQSSG